MFEELEEYVKPSRITAQINVERKALHDLLMDKCCVVMDDKRKRNKHKKRNMEYMLEEE